MAYFRWTRRRVVAVGVGMLVIGSISGTVAMRLLNKGADAAGKQQVVTLEFPDYPQHPEITYSVKYRNGHGNKPEGILAPGASVKVKVGMIFNVSRTGQS